MDATIIVLDTTDELQALMDAYHDVKTALDAHRTTLGVVKYTQTWIEADRIAFGVSDYAEAITELIALAADVERM